LYSLGRHRAASRLGRCVFPVGLVVSNAESESQAIDRYARAIALNPEDARAYNNRGNVRTHEGDLAGAIADYERAIELFSDGPNRAMAYSNRGGARSLQGDLVGAIADCERAIELDPHSGAAYTNRALARSVQGDLAAAIADYERAIEFFPDGPDGAMAYNNRAARVTP